MNSATYHEWFTWNESIFRNHFTSLKSQEISNLTNLKPERWVPYADLNVVMVSSTNQIDALVDKLRGMAVDQLEEQ